MLKVGRATSCNGKRGGNPLRSASIPAAPASDFLGDEVGGKVNLPATASPLPSAKCVTKSSGMDSLGVEVVKCADCPRTFERPIVPKGRPRLYCTKSCANYASRRRIKGTTGLTPVKVAMHNWQAQRRAAPPPTFSQALQALRGLPHLHAILSDDPDTVESAHGHEALRRTPTEVTAAPADPTETQQKPTPNRTRPKGENRKTK